jgi:hypothetical protein
VIDFLNGWIRGQREVSRLAVVRYEDMRWDCRPELHRVLELFGFDATAAELQSCVEFASLDNMKKLERENAFSLTSRRVLGGAEEGGEDSFKVRRGKVEGWRDYFDEGSAKAIQDLIDARLEPGFGYRSDERAIWVGDRWQRAEETEGEADDSASIRTLPTRRAPVYTDRGRRRVAIAAATLEY